MSDWKDLTDLPEEPPTPPLFAACEGIQFYGPKEELFVIHAGVYVTGNGALFVTTDSGEPYCKITVNMADVVNESTVRKGPLDDDEFYVLASSVDEVGSIERYLHETGFFKPTGYYADAGYVRRYADLWKFAHCTDARHTRHEHYRVTCLSCKEAHARSIGDKRTRIDAQDTIKRLKGTERLR